VSRALAALHDEALRRWKSRSSAAPPLTFHAEVRDGRFEVRARSRGIEVRARLSARFWMNYVASGGEACARCTARFFEKLFEALERTSV
jgi:hypothetical protein